MASEATDLNQKVSQELSKRIPQDYQKLKGDEAKYAESQAMVKQVIDENLTVSKSLRGKIKSASTADIEAVLKITYSSDQIERMRRGLKAETFRLTIDKKQGIYTVTTTRNQTPIYPQRRLETLADVDWAQLRQCASIVLEGAILFISCFDIGLAFSQSDTDEIIDKILLMIERDNRTRSIFELVDAWTRADSNYERANAIFEFLKNLNSDDILWNVLKLMFSSMDWWDWIFTIVKLVAALVILVATDGVALIAAIILALADAVEFGVKMSNMVQLNEIKTELKQ